MSHQQLDIGTASWHYQLYGVGEHLLIAFHGFGEDSSVFAKWEAILGETFTIIAVDLPFHGEAANWSFSTFKPGDFRLLVATLHEQHKKRTYSLVGFSFRSKDIAKYLEGIGSDTHIYLATGPGWTGYPSFRRAR